MLGIKSKCFSSSFPPPPSSHIPPPTPPPFLPLFLLIDIQLVQYCLLKRLSFLHWIVFVKNQLPIYMCGSIYEISILFHWSTCLFWHRNHALDYYSFVMSLEGSTLFSLFFFKVILDILGTRHFHVNFRVSLPVSTKRHAGILIEIDLDS